MNLIDRDKLLGKAHYDDFDMLVVDWKDIKNAPTVDAVPVVRCKDCKFWIREKAEAGEAGTYCSETDGMIKPGPDDFCNRGRRKERDDRSHPFADDVMMGGGEE